METYFETIVEIDGFSFFIYIAVLVFALLSYNKAKSVYDSNFAKYFNVKYGFFVIVLSVYVCFNIISMYQVYKLEKELPSKRVESVEGEVREYSSEKVASREESFIVGGVKFEYNDVSTPKYFFANRKRGDGVISDGRLVKVYYFSEGKKKNIVKVEVER
ncbi:hypothetical protein [Shewanella colwelliana]|uniref:hypothetical protein n=1 Tax=Shewanella colwelliana TaxID=23 RepID=UPI000491BE6E|nr:hypothetical protein [Shewanella colwelliana]